MSDTNQTDGGIHISADQARGGGSDDPVEITGTEARGGATPGMTRYILAFSLILVIAVFVAIYLGAFW